MKQPDDGLWRKNRTDGTCEIVVNRGDHRMSIFQPCGRRAEKDGLCSLHIKISDRRIKANKAGVEKRNRDDAVQAEGMKLAKRLKKLDADAYPYYNSHGAPSTWRYERKLIVSFDAIETLLKLWDRKQDWPEIGP